MPNTKDYSTRERIIDRCLRDRKGSSRRQMETLCNKELVRRGYSLITAKMTILNDMREICNKYNIVIESKRRGRITYYRYKDPDFSIYNTGISDEDFTLIRNALSVLKRYQGIPKLSWVDELTARLESSVFNQSCPVIMFEDASHNRGMGFFVELYQCISRKQTIEIEYKNFRHESSKTFVIYPYMLKQYNNRWFLLCRCKGYDDLTIFSLDRIVSVSSSFEEFLDTHINLLSYFDDKIGVSEGRERQAMDVVFRVYGKQKPYVMTKPLHSSQTLVSDQGDYATFTMRVQNNYELQQELLQMGEYIEIISPEEFRKEISCRLKEAVSRYK